MALIDDLRNDRGDAIATYYSAYTDWQTKLAEDGGNTYVSGEEDQLQAKYYAFNLLIERHHNLLKSINGFASAGGGYLDAEKGDVGDTQWWAAVSATNSRAQLYITNKDYAESRNALFIINNQSSTNQRHPYLLWNQYNNVFGTFDNRGWKNTSGRGSYSDSQNPLASGSNYRLGEPLEWFGNTNNAVWGRIVFNGYYHYRRERLKNTSFSSVSDSGFHAYFRSDTPISELSDGFTSSNYWPSPFEIMRYAHWGDGSNTSESDANITSAGGNSFSQSGDTSGSWSTGNWYVIYDDALENWALFQVTNVEVTTSGVEPNIITTTEISVDHLIGSLFAGSNINVTRSPRIPNSNKQSVQNNVFDFLWDHVYNTYYSKYKSRVDAISSIVTTILSNLSAIISSDYAPINEESGDDIGLPESTALKSDLQSWLDDWKSLLNDTGSGASYSKLDSRWSQGSLNALITKLKELLDFSGSYNGTRNGHLGEWVESTAPGFLGDYSLGSEEHWIPAQDEIGENNTGNLGDGQQLYLYRHSIADQRANRDDGVLFEAIGAYNTWNQKIGQIAQFENQMGNIVDDNKYDITPTAVLASQDSEDEITVEWDGVKAASSYDLEMKEGISGSWQTIATELGYSEPELDPPDFSQNPTTEYKLNAFTRGYQEFGLSFTDVDDSTGLPDDFTVFDFYLDLNGSGQKKLTLKGLDCITWDALKETLQKKFDDEEVEATVLEEAGDLRIRSNKKGSGSTVALSSGDENDLFAALGTTPEPAVDGTQQLEQGKVYYFRVRTNNGYQAQFGSDGDRNDKDWDSQSEWSTDNYSGDRAENGDAGIITWDEPQGLIASGFPDDNDLDPSEEHIRLEWQAAENAATYKIYRSTSEDGGYALIGNTSEVYYEDTSAIPGVVYYYKIQAVADSDYQLYEEDSDDFAGPLTSARTPSGVRGKRLWQSITLTATTTNADAVTISWSSLPGSNAYVIYTSNMENGQFNFISTDDGQERIFTEQSYVHKTPAEQFLAREFNSPNDGIPSADFDPNTRYYFILIVGEEGGSASVKQYYITSPSSGDWTSQDIADSINKAIEEGVNNATCELVHFENPSEFYKIKVVSNSRGENASIQLTGGTFGPSLLDVVGEMSKTQPGAGAYPGMVFYYQVEALEIISGEIVRRSERSNIASGERPLL